MNVHHIIFVQSSYSLVNHTVSSYVLNKLVVGSYALSLLSVLYSVENEVTEINVCVEVGNDLHTSRNATCVSAYRKGVIKEILS